MFNFIRKLFKALNSSAKPWQLSAAVVLAMFAGFLPSSSLIMLDLLFIALVLNINFGLFLLFMVIFSGIGYIFDPIFESIGYAVLTNESLNGLFTTLYNSVIFRWSAFNYTLVTGSLVVSTLLAIPMLFILNKVVVLYRGQIGEKFNAWKLTRWMNLFNEEVKSTSVFRWWGLGVFGGFFALITFVLVFVFDPLTRIALEKSLSYSLQTDVKIDDFSSSFSDLSVKISGIEVADKKQLSHNLVQVKEVKFDLGFSALVEKKTMIEHLDLKALAFNEIRKIPAEPYGITDSKEAAQDKVEETAAKTSGTSSPFSIPDVDDILDKEELKSITQAQALKADIKKTKQKWESVSKELKSTNEVDEIKADAKKLEQSLKGADLSKIASVKSDIDKLNLKIKRLKNKYTDLQKEFDSDQIRLKKQIVALKSLPQKDIERLKKKYSLNANGGANVIGTLINDEIGNYIKVGLKYYEMLKPYLNDNSEEVVQDTTPPRGQGRWVKYANHSTTPDLVVKDANINLALKEDVIDIKLNDFSSNQKLYGKPMRLHADANGKQYKHIVANVLDDRRKAKAKTNFDLQAEGFKKSKLDIQTLSMNEMLINVSFKGDIEDEMIEAKSTVNVNQVKLQMPSQKLINDLLSGITKFNVNIEIEGELQKPRISVQSDLDRQLSSEIKSRVSKATKGFEEKLRAGVMRKVSGSTDGMSADLGDTGSLLGSKQDALGGINTNFSPSSGGSDFLKKLF